MTGYYHERFFSDMRAVSVGVLALFVLGWSVAPEAFLLIPVVAVLVANQAAFDSSYLGGPGLVDRLVLAPAGATRLHKNQLDVGYGLGFVDILRIGVPEAAIDAGSPV